MYPRAYRIKAPDGKMKAAYRLVVVYNAHRRQLLRHPGHDLDGPADPQQSVQRHAHGQRQEAAAVLRRQATADGRAGRPRKAVYWVQNTLQERLTNDQMLAIAGSLTRLGGR